ncbi:hypothetical protein P0082_04020 [Candidatus Haliotispira prima]|uniref:Two component regulator propeller n=1 Tax=Candidatus Haliotispira prima TaxID=3034016 RepID=A0ABY8MKZ3_9SPIO|nr:hypothetical protein P0082_04020 [Candidatus Haliotispira prima]
MVNKSKQKILRTVLVSLILYPFSFVLFLQCKSAPLSIRQQIDRLQPDERILQAEEFLRQDDKKWALYAWNQTNLEDITTDEGRESYRLLKTWLFSQKVESVNIELADMQVSAMYLDHDDLWLGTWNGGIYRLSLSSGEGFALEADAPSLVPKVVYRIRKSDNAFWFAMHQGLRFYNYQTGAGGWLQMPGVTGAVSDFLENSEGLFVASLTQGAWHRTLAGDISPIGEQLGSGPGIGRDGPVSPVVALAFQNDIGLILGTAEQGAFRRKNSVVEPLQNLEPTLGQLKHVNHIVNDGSSLWFASAGEGLFRWNYQNSQTYRISSESFLLRSDRISALLHSGDWVFLGDDRGGLAGYHLEDQKWYMWDSGRNLEFSDISTIAYRNGELFYSTLAGGVYRIHWLKYLFSLKQKGIVAGTSVTRRLQ